jgi:hypothetical protein
MKTAKQIEQKIRDLERESINFQNADRFIRADALRWVLEGAPKPIIQRFDNEHPKP